MELRLSHSSRKMDLASIIINSPPNPMDLFLDSNHTIKSSLVCENV